MKVLVTGGAGYIGSVTVERLLDEGHEVLVIDNLSTGNRNAVHPSAQFVNCDLKNQRDLLSSTIKEFKPGAVIHLAANSLVGESVTEPFKYIDDNVNNALNLIKECIDNTIPKFILSSTANIFGNSNSLIDETHEISPGSPYGESKYIIERHLKTLSGIYDWFDYVTLRYFNAAGATAFFGEVRDNETHLIPLILDVAEGKRDKIQIYGDTYNTDDGTCIRDYIHVEDIALGHILSLQEKIKNREYNLGIGKGYSVKEVIATVEKVTGKSITSEIVDKREGDPDYLVCNSQKALDELYWIPRYKDLESIIKTAWSWRLIYPLGYKDYTLSYANREIMQHL